MRLWQHSNRVCISVVKEVNDDLANSSKCLQFCLGHVNMNGSPRNAQLLAFLKENCMFQVLNHFGRDNIK